MKNKFKSIFYDLDLIGQTPQLYIFGNIRYKSFFSSFISIVLIFFSFAFALYSFILYFKYSIPIVSYSKSSDDNTKRAIYLKDTFLMFQLIDQNSGQKIDDSMSDYRGELFITYYNGSFYSGDLHIDKCDIENIKYRFKDILKNKSTFGRPIEEFYCISSKSVNESLFYDPNIGHSTIDVMFFLKNNIIYPPEKISILIINVNNIIDHNNKKKPIGENFIYHISPNFNSLEYTEINFNFQYIKYESDNGLFFPDNKNYSGISFSSMTSIRWEKEDYNLDFDIKNKNISNIGRILFEINRTNYDNYKRSYQKLQSLLAELMSVISILFEVGKQISNILCNKKMSKDIITYILYSDKKNSTTEKNYNIKMLKKS